MQVPKITDKRKISRLRKLIAGEWRGRSVTWMAEAIGLTWGTVDKVRQEVEAEIGEPEYRLSKNGKRFDKRSHRPKLTMESILASGRGGREGD